MTDTSVTEWAVMCANGTIHRRTSEKTADTNRRTLDWAAPRTCNSAPHTVKRRLRITTEWEDE